MGTSSQLLAEPALTEEESGRIERLVQADQIRALYAQTAVPFLGNAINGLIMLFVLWGEVRQSLLFGWFAALLLLTGGRALLVLAYRRATSQAVLARVWANRFSVGTLLGGALWGSTGVLFYLPDQPVFQVFLAFVLGGMTAGAATSVATWFPAFVSFAIPTLLPISVRLVLDGDRVHIGMALLLTMFGFVLTAVARVGGRRFMDACRLRFHNAHLIEQLTLRSEDALARFRGLFDEAGIGVLVVLAKTLQVVDWNANAVRLLASSEQRLSGKSLNDIEPLGRAAKGNWKEVLVEARERRGFVSEIARANTGGEPSFLEVKMSVQRFSDVEYLLIVLHDVTEQKVLQQQLAHSDLLASVGSLAAGIAHEINNPLAYVINNLRYVDKELKKSFSAFDGDVLEALGESLQGASQIRGIVRDLAPLARSQQIEIAAVDINGIIRSSMKIAANEIRHRARLIDELGWVPPVAGDSLRLLQVFLNLLINAGQAVSEGHVADNRVTVRSKAEGQFVLVEVEDTGSGIPPEVQARIFEPFFTTKPVGSGTGLGLSICHSIVRELGGNILVRSQPGHGSIFRVLLPQATDDLPATDKLQPATHGEVRRGARVLVIDDDVLVARSIRRALANHQVTLAHTGREGLGLLLNDPVYDVVICDVMMPDLTGMEIHETVRQKAPGWEHKFIFLTGGAVTDQARAFLNRVDNPCARKPFDASELERLISLRSERTA